MLLLVCLKIHGIGIISSVDRIEEGTAGNSRCRDGIDIASTENQVIKATLDGTVIYSSWTLDFGYTIGIQHNNNYFSTYKHNATLLKKEGDFVKAGEAIAIVGESGEQVTGQHLHFELWHNGVSVNPQEYINFEKGEGE